MTSFDTDDIVATVFMCLSILLSIPLFVAVFTQKIIPVSKKMIKDLKTPKNSIYIDANGVQKNKSMLQVLIGDDKYAQYLDFLKSKNNGVLPTSEEISYIISPLLVYRTLVNSIHPRDR